MQIKYTNKVTGALGFDLSGYANKCGREFMRLVDQQFLDATDPYGTAWAPSKKAVGRTLVRSSALSRSFVYNVRGSVINVGSSGPAGNYAGYLHNGAAPYVILPRRASALRFVGSDGNVYFARRVNHPGLPARLLVPVQQRGLPQSWVEVMDKNLVKYVSKD